MSVWIGQEVQEVLWRGDDPLSSEGGIQRFWIGRGLLRDPVAGCLALAGEEARTYRYDACQRLSLKVW